MKLSALWLDDVIVIPDGKDNGAGEPRQPLREQAFMAADGWELDFDGYGGFRIWRDGMAAAVIVGGYGYSFVRADGDMSLRLPKTETASVGATFPPADVVETAPPAAAQEAGTDAPKRRRRRT